MTFSTRNLDPLTPLAPKFPNFAMQILLFRSKHTVAVVTHAQVLHNFYTNWVRGVACQKTTFMTEIGGGLARGVSKNFETPYDVFLQLLKLATSNLVHKLGLGLDYQKRRLLPKLAGFWARGASKINLGPTTCFCNR